MQNFLITLILFILFQSCSDNNELSKKKTIVSSHYEKLDIVGFQVFIRKDAYRYRQTKEAINLLTHDLIEIKHLVTPHQFFFFQKVKIWVEWEANYSNAIHYIPSVAWLKRKGYFREKSKSIEIVNIKNYLKFSCLQPYMVLHELAHAYHHQVLGYDQCDIMEAYYTAMQKQLYDSVRYIKPLKKQNKVRAYASLDAKEYFAELTESYYGLNDYFPFDKDDLQLFDPVGFELMKKIWGK